MQSLVPSMAILVLLVIAAAAVALLLRRHAPFGGDARGAMAVAAGVAVGPRERIALVRAGAKWLVVGITPQSITLLVELEGAPAGLDPASQAAPPGAFQELFRRFSSHDRSNA